MLTQNDELLINNIIPFRLSKKGLNAFLNKHLKNSLHEINEKMENLINISKEYYIKQYQNDKYTYLLKYSLLYDMILNGDDNFEESNFKNKIDERFNFIRMENNNYSFYPKFIKETDNFLVFEKIELSDTVPKITDLNLIVAEFRLKNPFTKKQVISPFYHACNIDDYVYDKNMNLKFLDIKKLETHENLGFILYDHYENIIYIYDLNPQSKIEEYYKYGCYDIELYKHSLKDIKYINLNTNFKKFFFKYKMQQGIL